jgi:hypothetical protein
MCEQWLGCHDQEDVVAAVWTWLAEQAAQSALLWLDEP